MKTTRKHTAKNIVRPAAGRLTLSLLLLLTAAVNAQSQEWQEVEDLSGYWKFTIGDNIEWADPAYDDSNWEDMYVPSSWEEEGFHGYNGFAWYRLSFTLEEIPTTTNLVLQLGYIDDVDEVFLNGERIGASGSFPPNYLTAYNVKRFYPVNHKLLNRNGENVLAVRVYDGQLVGGLVKGEIGLYRPYPDIQLSIDLSGYWKFTTTDEDEYKNPDYDDSNWDKILVPAMWESQGYSEHDGFAWYRTTVVIPEDLSEKQIILMLGKIDDFDVCYVNGVMIGATGDIEHYRKYRQFNDEYRQLRGYFLSPSVINYGEENVIAIRVFDGYKDGGIYAGPIGITQQDEYQNYWAQRREKSGHGEKRTFWDIIFE